jgi:hypothetical protein
MTNRLHDHDHGMTRALATRGSRPLGVVLGLFGVGAVIAAVVV